MHQTTVRFGSDLWAALEQEARAVGVSVAQYVREAALARLAYTAGRRGDPELVAAMEPSNDFAAEERRAAGDTARHVRAVSSDKRESSAALWAQARQARRHADQLRQQGRSRGKA